MLVLQGLKNKVSFGDKIVAKALEGSDMVEVDANKGIVRILTRK